jgi:hypothetical protein
MIGEQYSGRKRKEAIMALLRHYPAFFGEA